MAQEKSQSEKGARGEAPESASFKAGDHLYLIDGSGYIFRAYHGLPPLTRASDGTPVGAVHGFCQMLWKLLQETREGANPSHFAVIFDAARKNFRNEIYPDYKANRPPPPDDLIPQFPLIREAVKAFQIPSIEIEGYEADDLIATYASQACQAGGQVTIVSSDKDLMQLVVPGISMLDTMKNNRHIQEAQVIEKFGVPPEKVVDVQALAGDSTDNVPGVPGIGIKTAALLINEYGDLDHLLARAGEVKQNKRRENLITFADQARLSRELVRLRQDVPVEVLLDEMVVRPVKPDVLLSYMARMEFNVLTKRITEAFGEVLPPSESSPAQGKTFGEGKDQSSRGRGGGALATPESLSAGVAARISSLEIDTRSYQTVTTMEVLKEWIEEAKEQGFVAFDTETSSLDAMTADLVGFSLATVPGKACYVPLAHKASDGLDLEGQGRLEQIPFKEACAALKDLLEDPSVLKIGQNLKYDCLLLMRLGIHLTPLDDTMLISYVLDGGPGEAGLSSHGRGHGMDQLALTHLGHQCISFKDVAGSGKTKITFDLVPITQATAYAAEDADVTLRLWHILKPRLAARGLRAVYERLERPLVAILVEMEHHGVHVKRQVLSRLSGHFAQTMAALEADIHKLAGETFNIASPKQLGEILFDKMALKGGKKTKTGAWGTAADVLETLAAEGHDLPIYVLKWRALAKLKSTYTDALPTFINPQTGRIHTSYAMAATSTGRLASTDPNLQNIPIRTKEGRQIRTAFTAEKGNQLISADYSQIELRVLAHMADIASLKQAFADGLDIHAMTASEMFNVPLSEMDPTIRRRAKAINFGIIYGISAFGLANQLGISRSEAADTIATYFDRFPGIRDYMEETKNDAHKEGVVTTLMGRKIHFPGINTKNPQQRAFFERAAINAPIQGSAADIIRRAMIRMPGALASAAVGAKMLLQVHDELIFEAPEKDVAKTIETVCHVMEHACEPIFRLNVPLKVDAKAAANWDEAH